MPLDPKFGNVVMEVTSTTRDLQQQIQQLLEEDPEENFTITREVLEGFSSLLLVNVEMVAGLYEENQTIIDRLKDIDAKVSRIKE